MRPLRSSGCAVLFSSAVLFVASAAEAAPPPARRPPASSTQFTLRRGEAGGADAQNARARARAGDCEGALPSFDAAVKVTIEPTLRRDRGLCHEKLNHPFPAIDDYRYYLTLRPEAPDADQIRERLAVLEGQVGQGGPSEGSSSKSDEPSGDGASAKASFSVGSSGASGSASSSGSSSSSSSKSEYIGPKEGEPARDYDYYSRQEKLADAAESSPLREGEGIVVGAFANIPRYFFGEGVNTDLAFIAGGTLRYSMSSTFTLVSEFGFAGIGTQGEATALSGPAFMGGAELRLPITRFASDQILVRGGFGYERYTIQGTRAAFNMFLGRFAAGYRHVFGPSLGLELLADGGPAYISLEDSDADGKTVGVLGASIAFVVGF